MIVILIISMSLVSRTWPSAFIMIRRLSPWLWGNALRWAIWFWSPVLGSWSQCMIKSTSWNMSSLPNCQTCDFLYIVWGEINGLVEEKRNSSALAKGLRLSRTSPTPKFVLIAIRCVTIVRRGRKVLKDIDVYICKHISTRIYSIERHWHLHTECKPGYTYKLVYTHINA